MNKNEKQLINNMRKELSEGRVPEQFNSTYKRFFRTSNKKHSTKIMKSMMEDIAKALKDTPAR